jgi:hypothetical protein
MKNYGILCIWSIAFFGLLFFSCRKNSTGGDSNIIIFPEHHEQPVYGATVYVKYNAKDLPQNPTQTANLIVIGKASEKFVSVNGLRLGQYYLYTVAYDSAIAQTVKGGAALRIRWSERKNTSELKIAVSE